MAIFGKFNERAQRVIASAQQAAAELGHLYVGTEHFLIGLLKEARADAPGLPDNVITGTVTEAVKTMGGASVTRPMLTDLTPRAKKLLENSIREAQTLKQSYVSAGHLWLGIFADPENTAARILTGMGCDLKKLSEATRATLAGAQSGAENDSESCLKKYGRDLTESAEKNELDPVIGRAAEIERIVQILSRRTKNNPVLIGEPGVGKSAVAEGLAQRIVQGGVPETLTGRRASPFRCPPAHIRP